MAKSKSPTSPPSADDVDLTAEFNVEKYMLMKTGHLRFSHPEGGHDDVFWSMALAVLSRSAVAAAWKRSCNAATLIEAFRCGNTNRKRSS